jgi:hypothetical protein
LTDITRIKLFCRNHERKEARSDDIAFTSLDERVLELLLKDLLIHVALEVVIAGTAIAVPIAVTHAR